MSTEGITLLLDEKTLPVTYAIGFLENPVGSIADALREWILRTHGNMALSPVEGVLSDLVGKMDPLTLPPTKELLFSISKEWTAYLDNSVHGSDPVGPVSYLVGALFCRGLVIRSIPHRPSCSQLGAVQFEYFDSHSTDVLHYERSISLVHDGSRWEYATAGRRQPFEDEKDERRNPKQARLTTGMLVKFCSEVGIDIKALETHRGEGALFELSAKKIAKQEALATARDRIRYPK